MKITPQDLAILAKAIKPLDTPELRAKYLAKDVPHSAHVKDWDKRYRWDVLYMSGKGINTHIHEMYNYLNDDHIDTALRHLVSPLEGKA